MSAGGAPTPYSIASSPRETREHGWLEFLVKVDGSNRFGALVDHLAAEAPVALAGPVGRFTLDGVAAATPLLFIAGGTGIAPLRSMLHEAMDSGGSRSLSLLYSNRTPEEFAYLDELKQLAADRRLNLSLTLTGDAQDWTHARGRAGLSHLVELVRPDTTAFICGPPAMLNDLPPSLRSLGITPDRIITESW